MGSDVLRIGWLRRYDELIAFKQQHGHCKVPQSYSQSKTLGVWVMTQRHQYKLKFNNKSSLMATERQAALEKIGFKWGVLNHSLW